MGRTGVHTTQPDHSGQRLLSVFTQALFFDLFEAGANGNARNSANGKIQERATAKENEKGERRFHVLEMWSYGFMTSVVAPGSDQGATVSTVVRVLRTRVE